MYYRRRLEWLNIQLYYARTSATNYIYRPFQALSENVSIRADIAISAIQTYCLMRYISSMDAKNINSQIKNIKNIFFTLL